MNRKYFILNEDSDDQKKKKGGRFYIPEYAAVKRSKIQLLNKEPKGPHIMIVNNPSATGEAANILNRRILVSDFLKMALDQSRRGRMSWQDSVYQNKLLKRYNEIFEKDQIFKGALKKSLADAPLKKSSTGGSYYLSRLILINEVSDMLGQTGVFGWPGIKTHEMSDSEKSEYLVFITQKLYNPSTNF